MKHMLALPIPPLSMGVSWTGKALLRYCLDECDRRGDREGKLAILKAHELLGPDRFQLEFDAQARRLNQRFAARSGDGRAAPMEHEDPREVN
jgi:hypothetical protein